jgi:hypothetical protein
MFNVMSTRGTHLNPAFELPFGTHPLHFIILTLLIMHVMPPTIDCLCIILMVVVAVNWFRSRYFRVGHLPFLAWAQLVFNRGALLHWNRHQLRFSSRLVLVQAMCSSLH